MKTITLFHRFSVRDGRRKRIEKDVLKWKRISVDGALMGRLLQVNKTMAGENQFYVTAEVQRFENRYLQLLISFLSPDK